MNHLMIGKILGRIMLVEAAFMVPALILSACCGERSAFWAFAMTIVLLGVLGSLSGLLKPKRSGFFARDGFITVAIGWILVSVFGALPFLLSGTIPNFIDCLFESISGFTTTGASILKEVESLPRGISYWRSFTHWLGGMGVLVFVLAIGPLGRESGSSLHLLRAESPGPVIGKLVPRMQQSAKILYAIYIALTLIEIPILKLCGLDLFNSVTIAFGTAGTGGFGVMNDSCASYPYAAQTAITIFMALFGVNFNIYYLLLLRDFKKVFRNGELRTYVAIILGASLLIAVNIMRMMGSFGLSLHHALFQVVSIITTTGFATADFNLWPEFSRMLLFLLMFVGGCAGSTGGGLKVIRILVLFKSIPRSITRALRPSQVQRMHVGGEVVEDETADAVQAYFSLMMILLAISVLIVSLDGYSFESCFTAAVSCINNIGPALGLAGPASNYSAFSGLSKLILCADMLIGRLEIFPLAVMFSRIGWRK